MSTPGDVLSNNGSASKAPKKRSALMFGAVIFLSGVVVGIGLTLISFDYLIGYRFRHPEEAFLRIVDQMQGDLRLTPEQRTKVTEILSKEQAGFHTMFETEIRPKLDGHFYALRDEVAAVLTPQQAAQWKSNFEAMQKKFKPPFAPPPPPPGK